MAADLSKWRTPHFDQTESLSNSYFYNSFTAEPVRRSTKVWRHLRWPHTKRHNILLLTMTVLLARNSFRCLDNLDNKDSHTCIILKKAWRHTIWQLLLKMSTFLWRKIQLAWQLGFSVLPGTYISYPIHAIPLWRSIKSATPLASTS